MPTTAASITECSLLVVIRAELPVVTMTVSPVSGADKVDGDLRGAGGLIVFIRAGDNQQLCAIERSMLGRRHQCSGYFARYIFPPVTLHHDNTAVANFIACGGVMSVRRPTDSTAPAGSWRTSLSVISGLATGAVGLCAGFTVGGR